jgi:fatty acid synthase subunit alpha
VAVDKKTSELKFPPVPPKVSDKDAESTRQVVESLAKAHAEEDSRIGVDVENIDAVNIENETFIERNFTASEQEYCRKAPSPQSSFAGRWSAKEAVFKSLGVCGKGAGAPLKDIEILSDTSGAPVVNVSLSHSDNRRFLIHH